MSKHTVHDEYDQRLSSLNPVPDRSSEAQVDAALRRVLVEVARVETTRRDSHRRIFAPRRAAVGSAVAASAAVAAFAAINLLPASTTPGVSDAWAKRVVARVTAAVDPGSGVLHMVEILTTADEDVHTPFHGTVQSWEELDAPYAYWQTAQNGSDTTTTTLSGDSVSSYDSATGTLYELQNARPDQAFHANNLAYQSVYLQLHQPTPYATLKSVTPEPFGHLLVTLLNAPDVSITRGASVQGESAISVAAKTLLGRLTLYVQPQTYKPLQLVLTSREGGVATVTFTTYETLPAGSVSIPNLAQLHPTAQVVSVPSNPPQIFRTTAEPTSSAQAPSTTTPDTSTTTTTTGP